MELKAGELDPTEFGLYFPTLLDLVVNGPRETLLTAVDALAIWFLRAAQLSKRSQLLVIPKHDADCIFDFVCGHIDSDSGPMKNGVSQLLVRLLKFLAGLREVHIVEWARKLKALPFTLKHVFVVIEAIAKEWPQSVPAIIHEYPLIFTVCLQMMESRGLRHSASKTFAALCVARKAENWVDLWRNLVEDGLKVPAQRPGIVGDLLPTLFKARPDSFPIFVRAQKQETDEEIDILMGVLNAASTVVSVDPVKDGLISEEKIRYFLTHESEQYRHSSLRLLLSALRPSRPFLNIVGSVFCDPVLLDIFFKEHSSAESRHFVMLLLKNALVAIQGRIAALRKAAKTKKQVELELAAAETSFSLFWAFVDSKLSTESNYAQLIVAFDLLPVFVEFGFATQDTFLNLCTLTGNNYEDVRQLAAKWLQKCPASSLEEHKLENTIALLESPNGRRSEGALELLRSLLDLYVQKEQENDFNKLLGRLEHALSTALREDRKLHGYFRLLASLSELRQELPSESQRKCLIRIRALVDSIWDTIVKSMLVSPSEINNDESSNSWHSFRDATLLLKAFLEDRFHRFGQEEFLKICSLLQRQISSITHRGAFSAVFPTYILACKVCFENDSSLSEMPKQWLETNIKVVEAREQQITRRSAGLPYLILGVLLAVPVSQRKNLLDLAFDKLLTVATREVSATSGHRDLPQVHAFNCIKVIISDASLRAAVQPYISRALTLALHNLNSSMWLIKNAAMMLFALLQKRVFGTTKVGGEFPTVSASVFFTNYPGVDEIMYDCLLKSDHVDSVIPVLSMLQRLRGDGLEVTVFVDLLERTYVGHRFWKVREMAAMLIAALTPSLDADTQAEKYLELSFEGSPNERHGLVLCVEAILRKHSHAYVASQRRLHLALGKDTFSVIRTLCELPKLSGEQIDIAPVKRFLLEHIDDLPNGAAQLAFALMASLVFDHESFAFDEYEEFVSKLLKGPLYEVHKAVFSHLSKKKMVSAQDLINLVNGDTLPEIKRSALLLLGRTETTLESNGEWLDELMAAALPLRTPDAGLIDDIAKYIGDEYSESIRLCAIAAIEKHAAWNDPNLTFQLFIALTDDLANVRLAAASLSARILGLESKRTPIYILHSFMKAFIGHYGQKAVPVLSKHLYNPNDDVRVWEEYREKDYDCDRLNVYRNEVEVQRLIVRGLRDLGAEVEPCQMKLGFCAYSYDQRLEWAQKKALALSE